MKPDDPAWNQHRLQMQVDPSYGPHADLARFLPSVAPAYRGRDMTAADLGIIDQNLDDKIGMEPA
jgi:hypothetical protein